MAERTVLVRLRATASDFKSTMDQAARSVDEIGRKADQSSARASTALGQLSQSAQRNRGAWDDAGTALAGFGAITVAALAGTVKAAMDWESAWAGVTKTVDGSAAQMADLEGELRGLARTLPSTHDEIAAVAEAAGQLGVKREAIAGFTKTMVDLGQTTNLSADEAATSLAQLMNVMQTAPDDVGRLGAALVALGNAGASTEKDILNMASYLTGSAKLIGASESDVLALANAMTSMGINAERGGGVMTRVMQDVYTAVQTGGDKLEGFADVAGMSSAEFARAFEEDPIRAIDAFVQGLNGVEKSGGNVVDTLNSLGYKGTQDTAVLLQMKGAGDLLTESLDLGNASWRENTALVEEAAKRYDTTASKLAIARNNINDAAISIGESLLPMLADLAGSLADVAGWFAGLPEPVQQTIAGLAGVAGVAALAGGAFLLVFPRVIETYKAFQLLSATSPGVASGLGAVGKAAGIAGAIYAVSTAVDMLKDSLAPTPASMEETTGALLGMGKSMKEIDALFRENAGDLFTDDIDGLADAAGRLTNPGFIDRLDDFGAELTSLGGADGRDSRERMIQQLDQMGQSLALMVEQGNADLAASQFDMLVSEWKRGGGTVKQLRELMPAYSDALKSVENEQLLAAESATGLADATGDAAASVTDIAPAVESAYGSLAGYAAALGLSEEATKDLIKETEELGSSLAEFINPLGVYTGLLDEKKAAEEDAARKAAEAAGVSADSWADFVTDTGVSFDEYMRRLEEQVTAQANWQTNMLTLAGRVSQGTLNELARMGPEGAPLVAELVNRSDAELDRFDDITALRSKEATDAWGVQLRLAQPVLAAIGAVAGQGVVDELVAKLQAGTTTVADIAAQYGVNLAGGINPVLTSLGKAPISMGGGRFRAGNQVMEAQGGLLDFYANGGVSENHVAQIAPAGAWRVWAEDETGGEAYIPLSPAKRARSVDIWRETGRRLGIQDIAQYAFGGVNDVPRPTSTAPYGAPISTAGDAAMQRMYDEVAQFVSANVDSTALGDGAAGGTWQGLWAKVHAAFPTARRTSDFRPGDPGKHGQGKAVDIAGAVPGDARAMSAINRWLATTMGANLSQLIYTPGINLLNGRPHTYNASTRADHFGHVHAATLAEGGIFNPHIRDAGGPLLPGYTFNGTGAAETVLPNARISDASRGAQMPTQVVVNFEGAAITGFLEIDSSGMARMVNAQITSAVFSGASTAAFGQR